MKRRLNLHGRFEVLKKMMKVGNFVIDSSTSLLV